MPKITPSGSFDSLEKWLKRVVKGDKTVAEQFAKELVDTLAKNTPVKSGKTASSWGYNIS
ncbi:MAG: HK97 gp10 family phage protein, partial [Clostridia bacterium]|nr:HK97 gp10 family phage protein [Clostridia bacterium]